MYRFDRGSLVTFIITFPLPLLRMINYLSSNVAWHTLSQNVPMDSNALLIPGKRCAFRNAIGRSCLESRAVCVYVIIFLLGMRMGSGLIASFLLSHG